MEVPKYKPLGDQRTRRDVARASLRRLLGQRDAYRKGDQTQVRGMQPLEVEMRVIPK